MWVSGSPTDRGIERLVFSRAEIGIMGKEVFSNHIRV